MATLASIIIAAVVIGTQLGNEPSRSESDAKKTSVVAGAVELAAGSERDLGGRSSATGEATAEGAVEPVSGRGSERVDAVGGVQPADFGIGGELWPVLPPEQVSDEHDNGVREFDGGVVPRLPDVPHGPATVVAAAPEQAGDDLGRHGIGGDWPRMYVPAATASAVVPARTEVPVIPQPPIHGRSVADGDIRASIERYFGAEFVPVVLRIGQCESRWRADAISPDGQNWGALQVNLVHLSRVGGDPYALLDLETNIRVASEIWRDNGGFQPWACY